MDMRKIKKLIELIQSTGVAEIEIREGEESVRITRETTNKATPVIYATPPAAASEAAAPRATAAEPAPVATPQIDKHSALCSTVYLSASLARKRL